MHDQWLRPLDIPALLRQGASLQGELRLASLPRLQGVVLRDGPMRFCLHFARPGEGQASITGWLQGDVELLCQRCLQGMVVALEAEIGLGVVAGEAEAKRLPPELEPLILDGSPVCVADLIEEEILLSLPMLPMHAHACAPALREHRGRAEVDNPFEALRDLIQPSAR